MTIPVVDKHIADKIIRLRKKHNGIRDFVKIEEIYGVDEAFVEKLFSIII